MDVHLFYSSMYVYGLTLHCIYEYTKLIRRWDSERELFSATSSVTFTQCALEASEFGEITQNKGHYADKGHSRSPILVPYESTYTTSYYWLSSPIHARRSGERVFG